MWKGLHHQSAAIQCYILKLNYNICLEKSPTVRLSHKDNLSTEAETVFLY